MTLSRRFFRNSSLVFAVFLTAGATHFAFGFSSKRQARAPDPRTEQWLSVLNQHEAFGIDRESPERQAFLKERAKVFVDAIYGKVKSETPSQCQSSDPFCALTEDFRATQARTKTTSRRSTRKNVRVIRNWLTQAKLDRLQDVSDRDLREAIRRFPSLKRLEAVSSAVLKTPVCRFPALSFLLGSKAEELLPDEAYRQKAVRLYELAASCAENDVRIPASYRYSLLQIWSDHCAEAMPRLNEIADAGQSPYRSRALFWQTQCGPRIGTRESKTAAKKAKESLIAEFPFSLHSLLAQKDEQEKLRSLLSVSDSIARFRSQEETVLNDRVTAAEALISIGEIGIARKVLSSLVVGVDGMEPEFQLYLAWLYQRVSDSMGKFRTLAVLFKNHPSMVSRAAFELYYPRKELQIEVLREIGVNEFVVMSLIRQESAFNEKARSPAGAVGLMQVMPRTARLIEKSKHRPNLYDPANNIRIGSKYFSFLLKLYEGDTELALAAYNAGPGRVAEWVKRYHGSDRILFLDLIPFHETRDYVASIARNYFWYSALYSDTAPEKSEQAMQTVFKIFGT